MEKKERSSKMIPANICANIYCRLASRQMFGDRQSDVIYDEIMDVMMVYYASFPVTKKDNLNLTVTRTLADSWGMTEDALKELAWANTLRDKKAEFGSLGDMLTSMGADAPDCVKGDAYVLTNEDREYGAVTVLYPGRLESIGKKLGYDMYILPASVHECIIVPADGSVPLERLRSMVRDINRSVVAERDYLSDTVYIYDRFRKKLEITK